jgi:hypothetical protein
MSLIIETEETLIIETPERVPLAFALASIVNCFPAVAIDHFVQYLSIFLLARAFFSLSGITIDSASDAVSDSRFKELPKWMILHLES